MQEQLIHHSLDLLFHLGRQEALWSMYHHAKTNVRNKGNVLSYVLSLKIKKRTSRPRKLVLNFFTLTSEQSKSRDMVYTKVGSHKQPILRSIKKGHKRFLCRELHCGPTILAVKMSFPRRARRPRPSHAALRCDAQMSPSVNIFYSNINIKKIYIRKQVNQFSN